MIAAIYARKSNDQSAVADEAKSVSRQVETARAYAARKGWSVDNASIYVDDGVSGAEFANRPGYVRLLNRLKPHPPFDVLIVSELSRLGREQLETGYAVKQLSQAGVRIVSYLEDREILLETPTDKFLMAAVNFAAEIEREKARQRVTDAMRRQARQGYVCGGDCYGYRNFEVRTADDRRSHVDRRIHETEAQVIRRIFRMCAAGYGLKAITKQLNAEALPSPRPRQGRPRSWTPSTVRTVLYRDLYRGVNIWNKRRKSDAWGQRFCRPRPESEWIRAEVPHLRIVTDDEWNTAHQRIQTTRKLYEATALLWMRPSSNLRAKYLLSGKARCGRCGASMTVRSGNCERNRQMFYICASYDRRGRSVCDNGLRLPMQAADDAVLGTLRNYVLDPVVVEGAIAGTVTQLHPALEMLVAQRGVLEAAVHKQEREQERLVAAIAVVGQVDALARALRDSERQRERLDAELTMMNNAQLLATWDVRQIEGDIRTRLRDWRGLLRRHTSLARQLLAHLVNERIVWTPRKSEQLYEFTGQTTFDRAFAGRVSTMTGTRLLEQ